MSVGVDVGGTFTDLVAVAEDGRVESRKVSSTPDDQSVAVLDALAALGADPSAVARLVHGTTVATNALLERTGARVVLCATKGATDLLSLARQERASLYDLTKHHPAPLVTSEGCVAVPGRLEPQGEVRPLTNADAQAAAERVAALSPEIVAVSLLHAYRDDAHESRLAAALHARLPGIDVVMSSRVFPEIREYERTSTVVAEAYLRPRVAGYLEELERRLRTAGYPSLAVMTSSGGMRASRDASHGAAALALSGPAGGVVGAAYVARLAGFSDALTIDIGGTSADAGVVVSGNAMMESGGAVAGVPIALPRVLVETVSAGGGSVGWVDDGGALRVGPRSAGARPGPAAFGRGGIEPTITDAHVVLGTLRASRLSGGIAIDERAARGAIARLAATLGVSPQRVATAMIQSADAAMARALRRVSVERGIDPRRSVLVAFGGGGPLHACALAEHLGMRRVLVPPFAGVLSALGLAIAAERRDSLVSVMRRADAITATELRATYDAFTARAGPGYRSEWWARARYAGQGYELEVPIASDDDGASVAARFVAGHASRYAFTLDRPVEIVSARHAASGDGHDARLVRDDERGERLVGPSTLALADATMLVAHGWTARPLPIGGWLLEHGA
ncbi:MAG: hydantoinase/oxoprolinase family protein [Gemmatimonadaceae bacterium]